jgi:hypothetical protein
MLFRYWIFSVCVLAAFGAGYLAADRGAAAKDAQRTAVIADEKDGIVRVVVGGREVARFDSEGLRVEGFISYSLADGAAPLTREGPSHAP